MVSLRVLVFALVLTLLGVIVKSENSKGSPGEFTFDLSGSKLTDLYNSRVFEAERMVRPLGNRKRTFGPISHTGVRVTLENGDKWLIHKGQNFGRSSQTVVVDDKHMSDRWKPMKPRQTRNFGGQKTVADFVRVGGENYNLLGANCHRASRAMMRQKVSRG